MSRSSYRFTPGFGFACFVVAFMTLTPVFLLHAAPANPPEKKLAPKVENAPASLPSMRVLRGLAPLSLESSGLLGYLAPYLTQETGLAVVWSAAGDSQTLALARVCGGDVLLASDQDADSIDQLIKEGHALRRQDVMSDSFILAGPSYDPAGVLGLDIEDALRAIADKHAPFASRGDASGTNRHELGLWKKAERDVRDGKNGYVDVGQDMMTTLDVAAAAQAYVLADRASFLTWSATHDTPLTILVAVKPLLARTWSLIPLNSALCSSADGAIDKAADKAADKASGPVAVTPLTPPATAEDLQILMDWWMTPSTQKRIADFTREGELLFKPALPVTENDSDKGGNTGRSVKKR